MHAIGLCTAGEFRVAGHNPFKTTGTRNPGKPLGEFGTAVRIPRPQDDKAAARQGAGRLERTGEALVIRHQHQSGQRQPQILGQLRGRSCQRRTGALIRHSMSSSLRNPQPAPAEALAHILARIAAARKAALAPAADTTLIAVSKTFGPEAIRPFLAAGQRVFGENRVQEAKAKWPALRSEFPDIELHLIGALQSNKVREAVELFDAIHSLDRPKLAHALRDELERTQRQPLLFIQVNTGEERQKAGILPGEASDFIALCRDELKLPISGLMCIPPADEGPAPHFALLEKMARMHGLAHLSMGMSADFETAIRFGATHVRVGSAIFGHREQADL